MPIGDKKQWGIGAVCLIAVVLSVRSIVRQIPPTPQPGVAVSNPTGVGYPGGGRQMPGTRGQITTVSASAITIRPRTGGAKTFALTTSTKIRVDQKPVTATVLKAGQRARVVSTDNKTATEVYVRTRPFGGPGGGPGGYPGGASAAPGPPAPPGG